MSMMPHERLLLTHRVQTVHTAWMWAAGIVAGVGGLWFAWGAL